MTVNQDADQLPAVKERNGQKVEQGKQHGNHSRQIEKRYNLMVVLLVLYRYTGNDFLYIRHQYLPAENLSDDIKKAVAYTLCLPETMPQGFRNRQPAEEIAFHNAGKQFVIFITIR